MSGSEEIPHQTFERLVKEGGLGTLERLPKNIQGACASIFPKQTRKEIETEARRQFLDIFRSDDGMRELPYNCTGTHFYQPNAHGKGLLLKMILSVHTPQSGLHFQRVNCSFNGCLILWGLGQTHLFCILPGVVTQVHISYKQAKERYSKYAVEQDSLVATLADFLKNETGLLMTHEQAVRIVKHRSKPREVTVSINNHAKEARAQMELQSLFHKDEYCMTGFEGTLADSFIRHSKHDALPLQIKSSSKRNNGFFKFGGCKGYNNMIMILRPISNMSFSAVIPGNLIETDAVCFKFDSKKHRKYLIEDHELPKFFRTLLQAVADHQRTFKWPNGQEVDISTMQLQPEQSICRPISKNGNIEYNNRKWREQHFPMLKYALPEQNYTTIDLLINGFETQDKCARNRSKGNPGFDVDLSKSAGTRNGKHATRPYEQDDFKFLFAFFPNHSQVLVIPMTKLIEKGLITTKTCKGKKSLCVYPSDYNGRGNTWTKSFLYNMSDPTTPTKVAEMFR